MRDTPEVYDDVVGTEQIGHVLPGEFFFCILIKLPVRLSLTPVPCRVPEGDRALSILPPGDSPPEAPETEYDDVGEGDSEVEEASLCMTSL